MACPLFWTNDDHAPWCIYVLQASVRNFNQNVNFPFNKMLLELLTIERGNVCSGNNVLNVLWKISPDRPCLLRLTSCQRLSTQPMETWNILGKLTQCCDCWCPGSCNHQDIGNQSMDINKSPEWLWPQGINPSGAEYSRKIRSTLWLLMPWLLSSTGY